MTLRHPSRSGDGPAVAAEVRRWRLEKRLEDGTLFEVVEGGADARTVVRFRRAGIAPEDSYARGVPVDPGPDIYRRDGVL